jgi:CheY-like chemotaxis protein
MIKMTRERIPSSENMAFQGSADRPSNGGRRHYGPKTTDTESAPKQYRHKEEKSKLRVLAVDDEVSMTRLLRRFFGSNGCEVTVAHDGAEAWREYQQGEYDIVITDMNMPNMIGSELISRIREYNPSQAVYMLTGGDYEDQYPVLERMGVQIFRKPLDFRDLESVLAEHKD